MWRACDRRSKPWFTAAVLCVISSCHPGRPPRSVSEVAAEAPVEGDPAARGDWTQPLRLPAGAVPDDEGERDFPAYSSVRRERFELSPAQTRDVEVSLGGASLVVVQAIAFGKAAPIELVIRHDGMAAATATPVLLPPDRAEAVAVAELDGTGAVTVHVANPAPAAVTVQLVVEIAPRGGH